MDVRGVAGEEDAAHPVGGGLAFVAVEAGHPAGVVHPEVAAEREPGDLLDLVEVEGLAVGDVVGAVPADHAVVAVPEGRDEGEGVTQPFDGEQVSGCSARRTSARTRERITERPGKGSPIASRTALRMPSAPTTYAARCASVVAAGAP